MKFADYLSTRGDRVRLSLDSYRAAANEAVRAALLGPGRVDFFLTHFGEARLAPLLEGHRRADEFLISLAARSTKLFPDIEAAAGDVLGEYKSALYTGDVPFSPDFADAVVAGLCRRSEANLRPILSHVEATLKGPVVAEAIYPGDFRPATAALVGGTPVEVVRGEVRWNFSTGWDGRP